MNKKKIVTFCFILIMFSIFGCYDSSAIIEKPPAAGTPFIVGTLISLSKFGYVQKEYFYRGTAYSYVNTAPMGSDGKWQVAQAESASFKTRMIIFRPKDPAKFNGTIIVEWLNVTAGMDTAAEWLMMHTEILRRGYVWVGISAQYIGVEGGTPPLPTPLGKSIPLKTINYLRYGSLSHPGDSFSYDIFRQGVSNVRYPDPYGIQPLGEMTEKVKYVIAAGESQSATRLVTFINAFGPDIDFIDGYLIHSRLGKVPSWSGASSPLSQSPQVVINAPEIVKFRDDFDKPVLNLQTETDVITLGCYPSRQNDSNTFRLWEVAGTAHADEYIIRSGMLDKGDDISSAEIVITDQPQIIMKACPENVNSAPQHHFVANAALNALNKWLVNGSLPPSAPRLAVDPAGTGFLCDVYGNALDGIRSPYVDAPVALFSGLNSCVQNSTDICFLFGKTEILSDVVLKVLYPEHYVYVNAVTEAANGAVAEGFLLAEDAKLIIGAANASSIPTE